MGQIISALILVSFVAGALAFNTVEQSKQDDSDCERHNLNSLVLDIQINDRRPKSDAIDISRSGFSVNSAQTDSTDHQLTAGSGVPLVER